MPQDLSCPRCEKVFAVTEARHPVGVQCPGCDAELTAEFRRVPVPTPGESPYELVVSEGRPAGVPPPATSTKKPMPLDDDEEGGKRGGGSMAMVVMVGLTALVITLGGLGVTGYYLFTNLDVPETSSYSPRSNNFNSNPKGTTPKGNTPVPKNNPNPFEPPPPPPPPKDVFDFRPVPATPPPITAPTLGDQGATIELGGKVGAVAVGGGGKYLVMHIPDRGELKLFDVSKGDVAVTVNGVDTGADVKLAAGVSRAFLYVPSSGVLRVYSLPALRKEFDAATPMAGASAIAMGSRTNGPLLMAGGGDVLLMEVNGSVVREVEGSRSRPGINSQHVRAAPDGTAFATFTRAQSTQSVKLLTVQNRKWNVADFGRMMPFPGPDGNFYGYGAAVDRTGNPVMTPPGGTWTWLVPSATGSAGFAKVVPANTGTAAKPKRTITVTFHGTTNPNEPLAGSPTVTGMPEFEGYVTGAAGGLRTGFTLDEYLFYIPEAKLLASISNDRTKLVLRKAM